MNQRPTIAVALCVLLVLAACGPATAPTSAPTMAVDTPTPPPSPTASATPVSGGVDGGCPAGYTLYGGSDLAFSACYPQGWVVSSQRDAENEFTRVTFSPPSGVEGAGLRFVSVSTQPAIAGYTDQDFIQEIDNWLMQEYYDRLLLNPQITEVGGYRAVDAAYEARIALQRRVLDLTRWVTALRANDQRWFIEVAGQTQNRDELERMRARFLTSFHVETP